MDMDFRRAIAKSVALSILLWRDAAPKTKFPSYSEIVSIELGRLMTDPGLFRAIPGLKAALDTSGATRLLTQNPWDVDPRELLESFLRALVRPVDMCAAEYYIAEQGHRDVCLDLIKYRNKPQTNGEVDIRDVTVGVCTALGLDHDANDDVGRAYDDVYAQLVRV